MTDNRNTRRGGFYFEGETPYATVTTILKVIDKPALMRWASKETYYAMVKDPTISEQQAVNAPYFKSERSKTRGLEVHDIVESYKVKGEDLSSVTEPLRPYIKAFYQWLGDHQVKILQNEVSSKSDRYGYKGTCDLLATLGGSEDVYVIDVKTGKYIYDEVELQLSAYKQSLNEQGQKADRLAVLLLETGKDDLPTGNYVFATRNYKFKEFLAAKTLWEWQNQETCYKIGYVTGRT